MQVHELILDRHSPYAFLDESIDPAIVRVLFDAARHAASAYNEQPWRFVYATREEPKSYSRILGCLVEANQKWARQAPLLILSFVKNTYTYDGTPNRCAQHDLGLAVGNLTTQASLLGLRVHSMAGIAVGHICESFAIPKGYDIMTAIAVGYSDEVHNRKPRKRMDEIAALGQWNFDSKNPSAPR